MDYKRLARNAAKRNLNDVGALTDFLEIIRLLETEDFDLAHKYNVEVRKRSARGAANGDQAMFQLHRRAMLFDAPHDFDTYCRYIEWERDPDKRFYLPRRKQLKPVADAMQRLFDGKIELLGVSLPPGVGKTTISIFGLTFLGGRNPDSPMLGGSHSNAFLRGVYDECLRVMDKEGDYLWHEVFPDVSIIKTNAQDMQIDLGRSDKDGKRFTTFQFSSIGSGNAGKVRAESLLYCDDLVSGIEEAMSRERLDNLYQKYTTDLRQRKIGNCPEMHVATRWSVHDVLGRLERKYSESDKAEFIVIPALDENDESNFDYKNSAGFTTQFYWDMRDTMDDASWRALYMNQPIEREGQLYNEDELRRYFELPDKEPDAILAVCDTKDRGSDYLVMPIVYKYGNDLYLEDVVCSNGDEKMLEDIVATYLVNHNVQMAQFESNAAGGKIADIVQEKVKAMGGITKITKRFTTANKETKIIVNSPQVKENVLFKDSTRIKGNKMYQSFMQQLCSYTMAGRNKHDDVVDAAAMLVLYVQSLEGNKATVFKRPY